MLAQQLREQREKLEETMEQKLVAKLRDQKEQLQEQ